MLNIKVCANNTAIPQQQRELVAALQLPIIQTLFNSAQDLLHTYQKALNPPYPFIFASKDCAALYGRTPQQIVGLSDSVLYSEPQASQFTEEDRLVIETGKPNLHAHFDCAYNREKRWAIDVKFLVKDPITEIPTSLAGFSIRMDPSDPLAKALKRDVALYNALQKATQQGNFIPYLQPQIDRQGEIARAENLIRWSRNNSIVPPDSFIGFAEQEGLIYEIGNSFLTNVCKNVTAWNTHPLLGKIRHSVNVSPKQIDMPFYTLLEKLKSEKKLDPQKIRLEITETNFNIMQQREEIKELMTRMHTELGITFAVDDFGKEYSSLARLKEYPISEIKIDKIFIDGLLNKNNATDIEIIKSIVGLAHNAYGCEVVAEGIEHQSQYDILHELGIDFFQGYLFSKPINESAFTELLSQNIIFSPQLNTRSPQSLPH